MIQLIKDWASLASKVAVFVVHVPVFIVRDLVIPAIKGDRTK